MLRKLLKKFLQDRRAQNNGHVLSQDTIEKVGVFVFCLIVYSPGGYSAEEKADLKEQLKELGESLA